MDEETKKSVVGVTIDYEDGSQKKLEYYALIGLSENTWYSVMESPVTRDAKIKMNNYMVSLSNKLVESIGM